MKIDVFVVNSFTLEGNGGNPAGVVFDWENQLSEENMQLIAQRMGLSETAFIRHNGVDADYNLRFFTPTDEVPLCGHATIASFWLMNKQNLLQKSTILQKTSAGILSILVKVNEELTTIWMTQAPPEQIKSQLSLDSRFLDLLDSAFPDAMIDASLPIEIWSTGLHDILLPIESREALNSLKTNMEAISFLSKELNVVGVHAFVSTKDSPIIYARNFAPLYGIDEESATGTSNGALTAYLAHHYHLNQGTDTSSEYSVYQGETMDNPSLIYTKRENINQNESKIWVGGTCSLIETKTFDI